MESQQPWSREWALFGPHEQCKGRIQMWMGDCNLHSTKEAGIVWDDSAEFSLGCSSKWLGRIPSQLGIVRLRCLSKSMALFFVRCAPAYLTALTQALPETA